MQRFAELRPDILLSDIGLPGEDGCALMRRVRALPEDQGGNLPAVAITACNSSEDVRRILNSGFDRLGALASPSLIEDGAGWRYFVEAGSSAFKRRISSSTPQCV